jgi:Mrp family chromosome partitioning ATPase
MERQFDVVILDAPAVLPVVDSTIISPLVRGVLLVVAAGKTPIGACQQAISRLEHVNSQIIGAVLNKTKDMRFDFFYGAGYSYYYKGYRKEKR